MVIVERGTYLSKAFAEPTLYNIIMSCDKSGSAFNPQVRKSRPAFVFQRQISNELSSGGTVYSADENMHINVTNVINVNFLSPSDLPQPPLPPKKSNYPFTPAHSSAPLDSNSTPCQCRLTGMTPRFFQDNVAHCGTCRCNEPSGASSFNPLSSSQSKSTGNLHSVPTTPNPFPLPAKAKTSSPSQRENQFPFPSHSRSLPNETNEILTLSTNERQRPPRPVYVNADMRESCKNLGQLDLDTVRTTTTRLQASNWYYGQLNWKQAFQYLKHTEVGTFLIRDSSDSRYLFSLSVQTERGPTSVRIEYDTGLYRLETELSPVNGMPRFPCVTELVDYYVSKSDSDKYVWMDREGKRFSNIKLKRPLLHSVPSLTHLCRLVHNSDNRVKKACSSSESPAIPKTLESFLDEYPAKN